MNWTGFYLLRYTIACRSLFLSTLNMQITDKDSLSLNTGNENMKKKADIKLQTRA